MSGLVLEGNIIERLGKYFPAPYIERIIVNYNSIQVSVSMMFQTDETEYFDELIEQLQEELYVYVALVWDIDNINSIINKTVSPLDPSVVKFLLSIDTSAFSFASFASGAAAAAGKLTLAPTTGPFGGTLSSTPEVFGPEEGDVFNIIQIPFSAFIKSTETIVSGKDQMIVRYDLGSIYDSTEAGFAFGPDIEDFLIAIENGAEDLTVFAFSSVLDYNTLNEGLYDTAMASAEPIETTDAFDNKLANSALLEREISDISYEPLMRDGALVSGDETVFVDQSDVIFERTPIKTLDGAYRKDDQINHEGLVEMFYREPISLEDMQLRSPEVEEEQVVASQSFRDSLNDIIDTHGYNADILLRLNDFRKIVPEKTSATPIGRDYIAFAQQLRSANEAILMAEPLVKRKIRNPKIIDNLTRSDILTGWTEPDPPDYDEDDCLYPDIFMTRWAVWENTPESDEFNDQGEIVTDPAYCLNTGYIFFDFEKVVRGLTTISQIFDMEVFEKVFGTSLTNAHLRWSYVLAQVNESKTGYFYSYYTRFHKIGDPETNLQNNSLDIDYYVTDPGGSVETLTAMIELNGKDTPRYFGVPRSFNLASGLGLYDSQIEHDYRLLALEFADYCTYDNRNSFDSYDVKIQMLDYTYLIPEKIIGDYTDQLDATDEHSLASYLEAASEACSYNNLQDMFNAFFADGIMAKYEGNYDSAPWVRAPLLYALHLDFMLNTFNHEIDEILEYARKIIASISPTTGTLEQLQAFYDLYTEFYDEIYGDSTFQALLADIAATGPVYLNFEQTYEIDGTIIHDWQTGEWGAHERADYLFMYGWKKLEINIPLPSTSTESDAYNNMLTLVRSAVDGVASGDTRIELGDRWETYMEPVLEAMQGGSEESFIDIFCEVVISVIWNIDASNPMLSDETVSSDEALGKYIICSQHEYHESQTLNKKSGLAELCRNPDYEEAVDVVKEYRSAVGWGPYLDKDEEIAVAIALAIMWPNSSKRDTDKDNWKGDMYTSSDMGSHDIEDMQENEINWITELKARGYWDEDYESMGTAAATE